MSIVIRSSVVLILVVAGCSDDGSSSGGNGGGGEGGSGAGTNPDGGSTSANPTTNGNGGTTNDTVTSTSTGNPGDPHEAAHIACIDKINELRASQGLPPYERWIEAESCVDQQATSDEASGQAHGSWSSGEFPQCNGSGQNECLGGGENGITSCLDSMWAEKDQDGCAGCDACNQAYDPGCPNCDFYGEATGDVCGHYVNMSALYFTRAACGFSAGGGWAAINFQ